MTLLEWDDVGFEFAPARPHARTDAGTSQGKRQRRCISNVTGEFYGMIIIVIIKGVTRNIKEG